MARASVTATSPPPPAVRRLRAFAFDPGVGQRPDTAALNQVTLGVPWEDKLRPGPVGEYLEVVDHDPVSDCFYAPVDLNHPHLLASDGLAPAEGNPQFHQQMVYAVAMTTIAHFERALGRRVLWAPRPYDQTPSGRDEFVRRLRIYPHALREANAYYSPYKKALLFGYFPASETLPGRNLPGGTVFTCLSHDVIAHETTHALLDGLHRRFLESSNPDVLAFHEAFADLVALFQHFSFPAVLRDQIARTRGDLAAQNLLGELAQQFGEATGRRGALRSALGQVDRNSGKWEPLPSDPTAYQRTIEPHARGAILVAAIFDAFLTIYKTRAADLFRIATGGTGVLPAGDLHPDLVGRLAKEASRSAQHVLNMCIRALDYCPPVDLTFGEYLRALVTADYDLVPDDDLGYRVALIEAFRRRGIYPREVRSLAADGLRWQGSLGLLGKEIGEVLPAILQQELRAELANWNQKASRRWLFDRGEQLRRRLHQWMGELREQIDPDALELLTGLVLCGTAPRTVPTDASGVPQFEVHSAWPSRRVGPDSQLCSDLIVTITQRRAGYRRIEDQDRADRGDPPEGVPDFYLRGGCTIVLDLDTARPRYFIRKSVVSADRLDRQRQWQMDPQALSLRETYFGQAGRDEPFAMLHRHGGDVQ